jgi:8-amino-7-oxononanoate synthase
MTMNFTHQELEPLLQTWLDDRRSQGLFRERRTVTVLSPTEIEIDGKRLVNFGSNDYLSLAWHQDLRSAAKAAIEKWPTGAGASPLISGRGPWMAELEAAIAEFEQTEAAIVFGSGFATNLGTIAALANPDDVIFSDALNHASLIDGCRLSRAKVQIYKHSDMDHLRQLIRHHRSDGRQAFIVTDSVFSMDGDLCHLDQLEAIARKYEAKIVLDEAHATGVLGNHGRGLVEMLSADKSLAIQIGTLSKAVGSIGGFVAGRNVLIQYLFNHARSYIYSTAMPPVSAAAATSAIKLMPYLTAERQKLAELGNYCRLRFQETGWNVPDGVTPIIPIIVGDAEFAVTLSHSLSDQGIFAPCIRPPTVPQNHSMLRISLTVSHTTEQIENLVTLLMKIRDDVGPIPFSM